MKKKEAEENLEAVIAEQDEIAAEIKAAQAKATKEIREKKEAEARELARKKLAVEKIERERELAEIEKQELEAALAATTQKLDALEVPPGYVLCTIQEKFQSGSDYIILVGEKTYRFKAPKYLCALPEDLANKYNDTNHPIIIKP